MADKRNDPYMSVDIREATSKEIQKNIQVVKRMTKGMSFDENMGNVNWRRVRLISNFGYKFMPKAKGVCFLSITIWLRSIRFLPELIIVAQS